MLCIPGFRLSQLSCLVAQLVECSPSLECGVSWVGIQPGAVVVFEKKRKLVWVYLALFLHLVHFLQVNAALEDLQAAVNSVASFHQPPESKVHVLATQKHSLFSKLINPSVL